MMEEGQILPLGKPHVPTWSNDQTEVVEPKLLLADIETSGEYEALLCLPTCYTAILPPMDHNGAERENCEARRQRKGKRSLQLALYPALASTHGVAIASYSEAICWLLMLGADVDIARQEHTYIKAEMRLP